MKFEVLTQQIIPIETTMPWPLTANETNKKIMVTVKSGVILYFFAPSGGYDRISMQIGETEPWLTFGCQYVYRKNLVSLIEALGKPLQEVQNVAPHYIQNKKTLHTLSCKLREETETYYIGSDSKAYDKTKYALVREPQYNAPAQQITADWSTTRNELYYKGNNTGVSMKNADTMARYLLAVLSIIPHMKMADPTTTIHRSFVNVSTLVPNIEEEEATCPSSPPSVVTETSGSSPASKA